MAEEERQPGKAPPPPEWDGGAPPGWYLDPDAAPLRRYWDGSAWTEWTDETYDNPDRGADPKNDTLAAIGWITAIFLPLIGLIIGIVLGSRGDRRGTQIVSASIVVIFVVGFFAALAATQHGS
jgi:hypothetical protein